MKRLTIILFVLVATFCLAGGLHQSAYAIDVQSNICDVYKPTSPNYDPAKAALGVPSVCTDNQAALTGPKSGSNPLVGPGGILTTYIHILSLVIGLGAVIVIIFSGIRFITSSGDPSSVTSARNGVAYAVIGLAVAAVAQAMVTFVLTRL